MQILARIIESGAYAFKRVRFRSPALYTARLLKLFVFAKPKKEAILASSSDSSLIAYFFAFQSSPFLETRVKKHGINS